MQLNIRQFSCKIAAGIFASVLIFGGTPLVSTAAAERPLAPEKTPPGDIPDSQAFVTYTSALGFSLQVPEGWARTDRANGVGFADKYNALDVAVGAAGGAPTVESVTRYEAAELIKVGRAVKIESINSVRLAVGPAILMVYSSNSAPNPVTNKQLRLENQRYFIYRAGTVASLNVSAPLGADNIDQWNRIARSFKWLK